MPRPLVLVLLAAAAACRPTPAAFSDAERAVIADSVAAATSDVFEGAAHLDAAAVVAHYAEDSTLRIAENGVLYTKRDFQAHRDSLFRLLTTISPINKRVVTTVLDPETALTTVTFEFTAITKAGTSASVAGVWTGTFHKVNGRWMIVASHESEPRFAEFLATLFGPPRPS